MSAGNSPQPDSARECESHEFNLFGRIVLFVVVVLSYVFVGVVSSFVRIMRRLGSERLLSQLRTSLRAIFRTFARSATASNIRTRRTHLATIAHLQLARAADRYYTTHDGPAPSVDLHDHWARRQLRGTFPSEYVQESLESRLVALAREGWRTRERWWDKRVARTLIARLLTSGFLAALLTYILLPYDDSPIVIYVWPVAFALTGALHLKAWSVALLATHDRSVERPVDIAMGTQILGGPGELPAYLHGLRARTVCNTTRVASTSKPAVTIGEATGYDVWFAELGFSPAETEIYESLVPEFDGTAGQLAAVASALAAN
jgi:hypothetical protein